MRLSQNNGNAFVSIRPIEFHSNEKLLMLVLCLINFARPSVLVPCILLPLSSSTFIAVFVVSEWKMSLSPFANCNKKNHISKIRLHMSVRLNFDYMVPSADIEQSFSFKVVNCWSCASSFANTMHVLSVKWCVDKFRVYEFSSIADTSLLWIEWILLDNRIRPTSKQINHLFSSALTHSWGSTL